MKIVSMISVLVLSLFLTACAKKEEVPAPTPASAAAPTPASDAPSTPAPEPATTEEKK